MKNVSAAVIIVLLVVIAALLFRRPTPAPVGPSRTVAVAPSPPEQSGPTPEKHGSGVIYTTSSGPDADENGLAAHTVALHGSSSPARDALNALCESAQSPLPKGTTLRGIKIAGGLATADFSRAFETHFHGGSTEEAQTINSILLTLGQFPTIERVQILVDGRPIDALSNLPINGPLDVIRPNSVQTARGGGA